MFYSVSERLLRSPARPRGEQRRAVSPLAAFCAVDWRGGILSAWRAGHQDANATTQARGRFLEGFFYRGVALALVVAFLCGG